MTRLFSLPSLPPSRDSYKFGFLDFWASGFAAGQVDGQSLTLVPTSKLHSLLRLIGWSRYLLINHLVKLVASFGKDGRRKRTLKLFKPDCNCCRQNEPNQKHELIWFYFLLSREQIQIYIVSINKIQLKQTFTTRKKVVGREGRGREGRRKKYCFLSKPQRARFGWYENTPSTCVPGAPPK